MTRVSASSAAHHSTKVSAKTELSDFQAKIFKQVTTNKLKAVAAPDVKSASSHFTVTPKGMVDNGAELYMINGKAYVATSNFAGQVKWFEGTAADAKKVGTLAKDLHADVSKLPAKAWSTKAPAGADSMGNLDITPLGLMGVGTQALIDRDGAVWVKRTAVVPNAKPEYAKLG